jgi:hypothetical protein
LSGIESSEPSLRSLKSIVDDQEALTELSPITTRDFDDYTLAVVWSILETTTSQDLFGDGLKDIVLLTWSATQYYDRLKLGNADGAQNVNTSESIII